MCGIVCYIGDDNVRDVLINGLFKIEYRGYDSAGMVIKDTDNIMISKTIGKVGNLEEKTRLWGDFGTMGIAHTRWATHGSPSELNAHPHTDMSEKVFVVHNGVVENYYELRKDLFENRHVELRSDTDTELIAQYIAIEYRGSLMGAVRKALRRIKGAFGIAVMHVSEPDKIVVAKRSSPIIIGLTSDGIMAASDVAAISQYTDRIIYLEDGEGAVLTKHGFDITTLSSAPVEISRRPVQTDLLYEESVLGDYPHYMLKEIYEQPNTITKALQGRLDFENNIPILGGLQTVADEIRKAKRLVIVSCGTSYYAAYTAKYIFEQLTDLDIKVELASEFRYSRLNYSSNTLILFVSQSGETADTFSAVREAKRKGFLTLGVVNVVSSSIARETDAGVYIRAGLEVGVASTKCFTSQVVILLLIALFIGRHKVLTEILASKIIFELINIPDKITNILNNSSCIEAIAKKYYTSNSWLFLGRGFNYPIALEGALKLKEVSYIHAEGYAAGEMKHGPIALVDENVPSLFVVPKDVVYDKVISNMNEIKSRGGPIIAIATDGDNSIKDLVDDVIYIPETLDVLTPLLTVIPCQLLAYYCASFLGRDIDRPRNLAKCVTVE